MCAALQPGNFSAGVVIRGTIQEPGAILGVGTAGTVFYTLYCYRQHSSAQDFRVWVLLSSAQFAKNAIVIYSTVCRGKRQDFCKIYCYPAHNSEKFTGFLGLLSAAHFCCRAKIKVVMYGTFGKNSAGFSPVVICSTFSGWGLLFSAQFTVCIISFLQRRVLLFAAHLAKNHCLACLSRCYSRHNSRKNFCWGCYSAHNSAKILLLPGRLLVSTQFQEFSPGVVIHSTI